MLDVKDESRSVRVDNRLNTESVAVIASSSGSWKTSGRALDYLLRLGFHEGYYAISPIHDEVLEGSC